jgi:segregation and condensation protein B
MSSEKLKQIVEAALLAAGRPLSLDQIQALFEEGGQPEKQELRGVLEELTGEYAGRGIEIREVGSGFRIQVRSEYSSWVSRLYAERPPKYSRALLETLALIAYRQPITRGEIEDIRGVSVSSNIVKTLTEREWVRVVGHRDVPGKPALYATTKEFLDYFNLKSLSELPTLAEIRDLDSINRELELKDPEFAESQENKTPAESPEETNLDDEPMTGADPDGETGYGPSESVEEPPSVEPAEVDEPADYDPDGETDSITGDEFFNEEAPRQTNEDK